MADLTQLATDPTLDAVNQQLIEASQQKQPKAPAIPISMLGEPCERKLYFHFRMALSETMTAQQLRRFEDGYRAEDVEASRLSRVQGITLRTIDTTTGYSYQVEAIEGHLQGRLDGRITGLLQAPSTEHVWECKCVNEKKQQQLIELKQKHGEKNALKEWSPLYYIQAILYMHLTGLTRHYLTCTTPGSLWTISVITNADQEAAQLALEKAGRIKNAQQKPAAISDNPDYFACKSCTYHSLCHQQKVAQVNCRTCCHSTPVSNGEWHCAYYNSIVPKAFQVKGCENHLFLPDLIPFAKTIDASQQENWIEYQTANGQTFKNGAQKPAYSSQELHSLADPNIIGNQDIEQLRQNFNARVAA